MCWQVGASQSDAANLKADNIDWKNRTLNFVRQKTKAAIHMSIGPHLEKLLRALPESGLLFPYLAGVRECDRATEFKQRCKGLGIRGSHSTATATLGLKGRGRRAILSGLLRKRLDMAPKQSIGLMPKTHKSKCRHWMNGKKK